ncbi:MAG TPA: SGNH/GDSL hydrolase family protein [Thermoanaerobaculia bacterium]
MSVPFRGAGLRKALTAGCCAILLLAPVEFVARRLLRGRPPIDGVQNRLFRYDARLGWFPRERSGGFLTVNTRIFVRHNSDGFRDREHGVKTKPRIAFLGDSYVWGYDVDERRRFTELVQAQLPSREILNLGVNGYGNDQEYLLLKDRFDALSPDVVFLVFCADNDHWNNDSNNVYDGMFKPYYLVENGALVLRGVPVPRSVKYYRISSPWLFRSAVSGILVTGFLRAVQPRAFRNPDPTNAILAETRRFVEARGARFAVGMQDADADVSGFLSRSGIPWVSLSNPYRFPNEGHWTPAGHAVVAERIVTFMRKEGLAEGAEPGMGSPR